MSDAVYLFQAAALTAVIVRMLARRLDRNHRREFILLLGWLAYCLAALDLDSPWLHFAAWIPVLPSVWRASRRCSKRFVMSSLFAVAAVSLPVFAAHGALVYVACLWAGVCAGAVLYSAALRDGDAVKALIGTQFTYYFGALTVLAATGLTRFAPMVALVSSGIWIAMALAIGPRQGEAGRETDGAMRREEFFLALEASRAEGR